MWEPRQHFSHFLEHPIFPLLLSRPSIAILSGGRPPSFVIPDRIHLIMASSVLPVALKNKLLGYRRTPNAQLAALNLDL